MVLQRIVEVLQSFPQVPLWLALASAVPVNWDPIKVYFGITVVLSIVNWGGLARQVRGKVLSLREAAYVTGGTLHQLLRLAHHHPPPAAQYPQPCAGGLPPSLYRG